MQNPFIFGKVVYGDHFLNRKDEIANISETLQSGQNIICYSPRRYGKTSMMMRVKDTLTKKGQLVFFIDFFRVTSLEDLYNIYATSIISTIQSPVKTLITTIQNILPTINPKIVFKSLSSPTVEISVPIPTLLKSTTLKELFDSLEMYCEKKGKKGTVIFDEFQEITTIQDGELIEREMRSAFQHHKHISYAFLGSKHHLLKNIFRNKNRPFYNFGRHFDLDIIDSVHWREYIKQSMGTLCSNEIVEKILMTTENHPYYTQMYCHYLWEYAKHNKCVIDLNSMQMVINDILQRDSLLFSELWDNITSKERHLLKAIAVEETQTLYDKKFILTHSLGTASSIQKASNKLLKLDYIKKTASGQIVFVNPFFKLWITNIGS